MSFEHAKNFPVLKNDNLLRAARGDTVDRIPIWIMRQAGRYLPEYQALRKQHDFFTICRTPELACEVTMQPLRRFDLDASIIFSDILRPGRNRCGRYVLPRIPQALGMTVEMVAGKGPVFRDPLESPIDLKRLTISGAVDRLKYVGDAITLTRHTIDGKVPLIGFSGAPWTLLGYMIEGGGSKTMSKAKQWLTDHNEAVHQLLSTLVDVIVDYLEMQVKAGAQMLQIFESSADYIDKEQFAEVSLPYTRRIRDQLHDRLQSQSLEAVPMILFAKGGGHSLREQSECGYDVIGVDYNVDPVDARKAVGPNVTLQDNLNPADMYKSADELEALIEEMVRKFGKQRYIANLGHGITPQTPFENVLTFVDTVHKVSKDLK